MLVDGKFYVDILQYDTKKVNNCIRTVFSFDIGTYFSLRQINYKHVHIFLAGYDT